MSKATERFYFTSAWQNCREAYARSRRGLCEICAAQGLITPGEIVHHKIHLTPQNINDPSVTLNWDNLQLVCRRHHEMIHDKRKRRYTIDEQGHVHPKE